MGEMSDELECRAWRRRDCADGVPDSSDHRFLESWPMTVRIVEHALEYQDRVQAFNCRMKQKGSTWAFYVHPIPRWLPKKGEQPVWRQYYLAVDDQGEVRGAYCLKRQDFWFDGRVRRIASLQGPVSEGVVDSCYSFVALLMIRDALAREPLLFGYGGNASVTKLLEVSKWWISQTPLCVRVLRPNRFLTLNRMLNDSTSRRWILHGLAFSGLGWIGLNGLTSLGKLIHRCPLDAEYEFVEAFDDWADELWLRSRKSYDITAVRDQKTLNTLMPRNDWPPVMRLKVKHENRIVGVVSVLDTQMQDDSRFGSLRVGAIVENFGSLEHCGRIIASATSLLHRRGVDIIVSNQTHPRWLHGFRANGFQVSRGHRVLTLSPSLKKEWDADKSLLKRLHMNNLDGEGPLGLAPFD
jgi:hypothetical protein